MRIPIALLAATGTLAVGVSACGAAGHAAPSTTTATAAAATVGTKLSLSAASSGQLMFSTKTLKAHAGTVQITFTNHSPESHNLTVVRGTSGSKLGATPTFDGGSRTLTLHLTAGRYTYYCSVPGHRQAGMQGTLTVS